MYRFLLVVVLFVTLLGTAAAAQPALAQDGNLLQNPGFEGSYSAYTPQTAQERDLALVDAVAEHVAELVERLDRRERRRKPGDDELLERAARFASSGYGSYLESLLT